jgi:hypothetical protein
MIKDCDDRIIKNFDYQKKLFVAIQPCQGEIWWDFGWSQNGVL